MRAALETRDHAIIEATAVRVQLYGDEITAAMLCEYAAISNGESFESLGLDAARGANRVAHALTNAMVERSPGTIERAIQDATGAIRPLRAFADSARRFLAPKLAVRGSGMNTASRIVGCLLLLVTLGACSAGTLLDAHHLGLIVLGVGGYFLIGYAVSLLIRDANRNHSQWLEGETVALRTIVLFIWPAGIVLVLVVICRWIAAGYRTIRAWARAFGGLAILALLCSCGGGSTEPYVHADSLHVHFDTAGIARDTAHHLGAP
jgi:hypothetical protein